MTSSSVTRKLSRFLFLVFVCTLGGVAQAAYNSNASPVYQRDGEWNGWYAISDCSQLQNMKNNLTANYFLTQDIECSDTSTWNSRNGFEPVGEQGNRSFSGHFDGNSKTVSNLYIRRPSLDRVGLFGIMSANGSISNVGLVNVNINGSTFVGGLVGNNNGGSISNSYSTGFVSGSAAAKTGNDSYVGGLVGNNGGSISNSYSAGTVGGYGSTGGLVGVNSGTVYGSYSTMHISGSGNKIGGLVGDNRGSISNSYSTGIVSGVSQVGGLVGSNGYQIQILNSYSIADVSASSQAGGLAGYSNQGISNSFFGNQGFLGDEGRGIPKTFVEMRNKATFYNAGWDISLTSDSDDTIWQIDEKRNNNRGYPYLTWQFSVTELEENQTNTNTSTTTNQTLSVFPPVNVSSNSQKIGGELTINGLEDNFALVAGATGVRNVFNRVFVGASDLLYGALFTNTAVFDNLKKSQTDKNNKIHLKADGNVGADRYCDSSGENCIDFSRIVEMMEGECDCALECGPVAEGLFYETQSRNTVTFLNDDPLRLTPSEWELCRGGVLLDSISANYMIGSGVLSRSVLTPVTAYPDRFYPFLTYTNPTTNNEMVRWFCHKDRRTVVKCESVQNVVPPNRDGACSYVNNKYVFTTGIKTMYLCANSAIVPPPDFVETPTGFTWTCPGSGTGTSASCQAFKAWPGHCGSANGTIVASQPTGTKACLSGNPINMYKATTYGETHWYWDCDTTPRSLYIGELNPKDVADWDLFMFHYGSYVESLGVGRCTARVR